MASISVIYRKDKLTKLGEAPIHFRIIKDRKVSYIASGLKLPEDHWDFKKNCIKPKHPNSARLNSFLSNKFTELQDQVFEHETIQKSLTTRQLRDKVYGKKPTDFFPFAESLFKGYLTAGRIGTYDKNTSIIEKFKNYAGKKNIAFQDITVEYLTKYEKYLSEDLKNKTNTIQTNFKVIRQIFNEAYKQDIIEHSVIPFNKYKIKSEKTNRTYLSEEELTKIENFKTTPGTRLELHRDMFIFAAYSGGLRISDMLQLQWKHFDGQHINFTIKKTGSQLSIKVPNKGLELIRKYKPAQENGNAFIFPMFTSKINLDDPRELDNAISSSTAYVNKNLNHIKTKLELDKPVSFHISRHTFATRALRKGISIDKVSKLMGHAAIKETQIYAKIVSAELDKAMDVFND